MAQLIDILRVVVGPEYFTATVQVAEGAPLMTSEDLEGTTRVYNLMPTIVDHACMGDAGTTFKDCMGNTEVAHLLEHMTVELLARTNLVNEIMAGRTWRELAYDRTYSIQLDCVDDVLVAGALSSAAWILSWAFSGGEGPVPNVNATVAGLVQLVENLPVEDEAAGYGAYDDEGYDNVYERANEEAYYEPYDEYLDADYEDSQEPDEDLDRGPAMSQKII